MLDHAGCIRSLENNSGPYNRKRAALVQFIGVT